jgi:hypothetical protein
MTLARASTVFFWASALLGSMPSDAQEFELIDDTSVNTVTKGDHIYPHDSDKSGMIF